MTNEKIVAVLDPFQRFYKHVTPAEARILLNKGKARVFKKEPFMIIMRGDGEEKMQRKKRVNLRNYFNDNEEVYVKNVSNTQVSFTITKMNGSEEFALIGKNYRPYILTEFFDKDELSRSADLRKLLNRHPPVLQLITEEEFMDFHQAISKANGTDIEDEIDYTYEQNSKILYKDTNKLSDPPKMRHLESRIDDSKDDMKESVERIHPRVWGIVNSVGRKVPKDERMSSFEVIEELKILLPELQQDDLEIIATKGHYKDVKKWASEQLVNFEDSSEELEE